MSTTMPLLISYPLKTAFRTGSRLGLQFLPSIVLIGPGQRVRWVWAVSGQSTL